MCYPLRGLKWLSVVLNVSAIVALVHPPTNENEFPTPEGTALHAALVQEVATAGKPEWQPVLRYLARLHGQSVSPATGFFPHAYQSLGPGYMRGRAFGHWDLTHERLDTLRASPEHVRQQIRNELAGQQPDGLIPGLVTFGISGYPGFETLHTTNQPTFKVFKGFPPVWVIAVDAYVEQTGDRVVQGEALTALEKQIGWFEAKRAVPGGGFYYLDVVSDVWESGVDEGIRFLDRPAGPAACVDATAHVFLMYDYAARWSEQLQRPAAEWKTRAAAVQRFIREELWDEDSGFFYDQWSVRAPAKRHLTFEGMWPVVVGAASPEQARRVITEHLMDPQEFFTPHPLATVARSDPKFELRMWRGPVWNCMTYWAARGCVRYGHREAAHQLLGNALDATAAEHARSGTIWEFYHPMRGEQSALKRKTSGSDEPCRDYVGHNPLFAMAALWRETAKAR